MSINVIYFHRASLSWKPTCALTCVNVPVWCPALRRSEGTACGRDFSRQHATTSQPAARWPLMSLLSAKTLVSGLRCPPQPLPIPSVASPYPHRSTSDSLSEVLR
jgi:hypothetical protein